MFKDGATQINISLSFKLAEHDYRIFAMTETLTCYGCGAYGNTRYHCPDVNRIYSAAAEGGSGPPVTAAVGSGPPVIAAVGLPFPPVAVLVHSVNESPIAQECTSECSGVTKDG